jgi:hypothetical protein
LKFEELALIGAGAYLLLKSYGGGSSAASQEVETPFVQTTSPPPSTIPATPTVNITPNVFPAIPAGTPPYNPVQPTKPLVQQLTENMVNSVLAPVGGYNVPRYTVQSWVGSISDSSVKSFYIQDIQTGTTLKGYSAGMVSKMHNEGILTVPDVIHSYLKL